MSVTTYGSRRGNAALRETGGNEFRRPMRSASKAMNAIIVIP
jgi:hypothetical protein